MHEHFDGIHVRPMKLPNFLVHYVGHDEERVDCPLEADPSGDLAPITSHLTKRHRTLVHIVFRTAEMRNLLVKYLKDGCEAVVGTQDMSYQMALYYEDATEAKEFLDFKEKETRALWKKFGF